MIRNVAIAALAVAAVAAAGCNFRPYRPEPVLTPMEALDRAERMRSEADRAHPECRQGGRPDDKDYQRRCMDRGGAS